MPKAKERSGITKLHYISTQIRITGLVTLENVIKKSDGGPAVRSAGAVMCRNPLTATDKRPLKGVPHKHSY